MHDREAVVASVDLAALADELLGTHRGSDRSPKWPCPNPEHPQTGRTPPVSVFTTRWGEQRWRCHGCGNGGSAIDLVMQVRAMTAREALAALARRAGIPELPPGHQSRPRPARRIRRPQVPAPVSLTPRPTPALERYVAECAARLWAPEGEPVRRWLTEARGLPGDVLRANRIGVDLGPRHQARPEGVPNARRAVVLPVLVDGQACYVQLRILNAGPSFPRYLSSSDSLAPNPLLGIYRPARTFDLPFKHNVVLVTEGIVDALSAAAGGYTAAAVLGASYADPRVAMALARLDAQLVVAFDPDPAGRAGTEQLCRLLRGHRRYPAVLKLRDGDLNEHLVRSAEWPLELAARVEHATYRKPPALTIAR